MYDEAKKVYKSEPEGGLPCSIPSSGTSHAHPQEKIQEVQTPLGRGDKTLIRVSWFLIGAQTAETCPLFEL